MASKIVKLLGVGGVGLAITLAGVSYLSSAVGGETARRVVVRSSTRNCYTYRQNAFLQQQAHYVPHHEVNYGQYLVGESLRINAIAVKLADAVEEEFRRRRKRPLPDDTDDVSPENPPDPLPDSPAVGNLAPLTESLNKVIQNSCVSCHSGNDAKKGFSLDSPENLSSLARQAMLGAVVTGYMPYKHAALTDEEVKLFEDFTKKVQEDD